MKTQYENTAILLIIKGGGGRVSLDGVTACGLVNGADRIQVIAWQSVLLTGLRHGLPAYRYLGGILAWRRGLLSGLRHGHPDYRGLSGIPARRSALLTGLWHGDPAYRCLSGIPAWQRGLLTCLDPVIYR